MLEINTTTEQDILLVELEGVLDSQTASDFKSWIEEKIIEGYRAFGIGCHSLKYISSRGIGALIELQQLLALREGQIALYRVRSEVERLLEFLKLTDDIKIYLDSDEVIDHLKGYHKKEEPIEKPQVEAFASEEQILEEAEQAEEKEQATSKDATVANVHTSQIEETAGPASPIVAPVATLSEDNDELLEEPTIRVQPQLLDEELTDLQEELTSPEPELTLGGTISTAPESKEEAKFLIYDEEEMVDLPGHALAEENDEPLPEDEPEPTLATEKPKAVISSSVTLNESHDESPLSSERASLPSQNTQVTNEQNKDNTIFCPNCGAKLRVSMRGKYLCPSCRTKFQYPFN